MPKEKKQNKSDLKLLHTIVCDDIRREDNGKFFLIGVYPEAIVMNTLPAQIPLSVWMQFSVFLEEKIPLEFKMEGSAIEESIPFSLEIGDEKVFGKDAIMPVVVQIPIKIKSAGNILVSYKKTQEKKWKVAKDIKIKSKVPLEEKKD